MKIIIIIILIFLIWFGVAVFQVKNGKNSNVLEAMFAILKEFWTYCNTSNVQAVPDTTLYPYPIDSSCWLSFQKWIKDKFVSIVYSESCFGNGVVGAKYLVMVHPESNKDMLVSMLERNLRNFLLETLNLHQNTYFSIFVYLDKKTSTLQLYYAINKNGVQLIENQKRNQKSRKMRNKSN